MYLIRPPGVLTVILHYKKYRAMTSKILISSDVCKDEVVLYLARRYKCTPTDIISRFLQQERFVSDSNKDEQPQTILEKNEMEILRDMNICPSEIEFV